VDAPRDHDAIITQMSRLIAGTRMRGRQGNEFQRRNREETITMRAAILPEFSQR
jgi:hypothetical protein